MSIVTVDEGLFQGNEISLVRKKLSCPIADGGDLTLTVKQRATLSRLGVETASNSFHLSM